MVAVFHLTNPDRFVVSDYQCPHAGADLTGGQLRRHYIICPQHQWKFDLITGHCVSDDQAILRRYECQVIGNELHADLDQPLPISPPAHYNF